MHERFQNNIIYEIIPGDNSLDSFDTLNQINIT